MEKAKQKKQLLILLVLVLVLGAMGWYVFFMDKERGDDSVAPTQPIEVIANVDPVVVPNRANTSPAPIDGASPAPVGSLPAESSGMSTSSTASALAGDSMGGLSPQWSDRDFDNVFVSFIKKQVTTSNKPAQTASVPPPNLKFPPAPSGFYRKNGIDADGERIVLPHGGPDLNAISEHKEAPAVVPAEKTVVIGYTCANGKCSALTNKGVINVGSILDGKLVLAIDPKQGISSIKEKSISEYKKGEK